MSIPDQQIKSTVHAEGLPLQPNTPLEALRRYKSDGVVLLRNMVSPDDLSLLRDAVDRQFAARARSPAAYDFQDLAGQFWTRGGRFRSASATRFDLEKLSDIVANDPDARPLYDEAGRPPKQAGVFFYEAAGWRTHAGIRRVAMDSELPETAAALLESETINFWEDTTFIKTPGATLRTPFHQDYTYFQIQGAQCCVMWVALDDVDEENGALEYVIGSHRWAKEFAPNVFVSQTPLPDSPYQRLPDIERRRDEFDIRAICAKAGDVIVHDVLTVHGARGNCSSDKLRRGISFRYCGDDIRYFDKPGAIRQPWVQERLSDGAPLYSKDYPRVWPLPFPGAELSRLYD